MSIGLSMSPDETSSELAALIAEFEASGFAELHLTTKGYDLRLLREPKADEPGE